MAMIMITMDIGQATPRSGQRLPLGSKIVPTMMALMASQTLAYDAVDPQF